MLISEKPRAMWEERSFLWRCLKMGWLQTTVNIVSVSKQSGLRTKVSVLELTMHPLPWPSPLTSRGLSAPSLGRKWPGLHEITRRKE